MKRRPAIILVVLVAAFAASCGAVEDEVRQRADEEINERSTQIEDRVEEEVTGLMEDGQ